MIREGRSIVVCRGDELMIPDRIGAGGSFAPVNLTRPKVVGRFTGAGSDYVVSKTSGTWSAGTVTGQFVLNGVATGITASPHTFSGVSSGDQVIWRETAVNAFGTISADSDPAIAFYSIWDTVSGSEVLSGSAASFAFTRGSSKTYWNGSAKMASVASNVLAISRDPGTSLNPGYLFEDQRTNKCSNFNANPTVTTGFNIGSVSGSTLPTLTVVSDVTELAAAGLDLVCTGGNVFKLDNTAGVNSGYVLVPGTTGNVNPHFGSAWIRGGAGTIGNASSIIVTGSISYVPAAHYRRVMSSAMTPGSTGDRMAISANAGQVVFFILNQYEEVDVSSEIIVAGSQVTRAADVAPIPTTVNIPPSGGIFLSKTKPYVGSVFTTGSRLICRLGTGTSTSIGIYMGRSPTLYYFSEVGNGSTAVSINAGMTAVSSGYELTLLNYQTTQGAYYARRTLPAAATISAQGAIFSGASFGTKTVGVNFRGKIQRIAAYSGLYTQTQTQDFINAQS